MFNDSAVEVQEGSHHNSTGLHPTIPQVNITLVPQPGQATVRSTSMDTAQPVPMNSVQHQHNDSCSVDVDVSAAFQASGIPTNNVTMDNTVVIQTYVWHNTQMSTVNPVVMAVANLKKKHHLKQPRVECIPHNKRMVKIHK